MFFNWRKFVLTVFNLTTKKTGFKVQRSGYLELQIATLTVLTVASSGEQFASFESRLRLELFFIMVFALSNNVYTSWMTYKSYLKSRSWTNRVVRVILEQPYHNLKHSQPSCDLTKTFPNDRLSSQSTCMFMFINLSPHLSSNISWNGTQATLLMYSWVCQAICSFCLCWNCVFNWRLCICFCFYLMPTGRSVFLLFERRNTIQYWLLRSQMEYMESVRNKERYGLRIYNMYLVKWM